MSAYCQEMKEFFNAGDMKTVEARSLYYKTGVKTDDGVLYQGKILSYYTATNTIRSEENYNDKGTLNGELKHFYENGILKKSMTYEDGSKMGVETEFYPTGKPQVEKDRFSRILNYWDSTGSQLVADGNGFCKCYYDEKYLRNAITREEGRLVDSYKDGTWKTFRNDTLEYEENFSRSIFLNGINYRKGEPIHYTEIEKRAEFIGGMSEMVKYLSKNIIYPKEAKKLGISGKVFVEFVVDKDGSILDPKIIKGINEEVDLEALRVISQMPKWMPGYQKGIPVKSKFVLPLKF
jgi:TonB family protein